MVWQHKWGQMKSSITYSLSPITYKSGRQYQLTEISIDNHRCDKRGEPQGRGSDDYNPITFQNEMNMKTRRYLLTVTDGDCNDRTKIKNAIIDTLEFDAKFSASPLYGSRFSIMPFL